MQLYKDFNSIMKQHSMLLSCTYEMRGAYSVLVIQLQLFFNVRTYIYCPWTPFRCCLVSPLSVSPWTSPICSMQCTEVRFASFLSGGFIHMAVINPPEMKVANRTSVQCWMHDCNFIWKIPKSSSAQLNLSSSCEITFLSLYAAPHTAMELN